MTYEQKMWKFLLHFAVSVVLVLLGWGIAGSSEGHGDAYALWAVISGTACLLAAVLILWRGVLCFD